MGRYVYVASGEALEAVVATEHTEPQAVIGSTLQRTAYPDDYRKFVSDNREARTAFEHKGNPRRTAGTAARRVCVRRGGRGRFASLRCRADRSERLFGTYYYSASFAVWPKTFTEDEIRDGRRRALDPWQWIRRAGV